jgi:hypothetical protein
MGKRKQCDTLTAEADTVTLRDSSETCVEPYEIACNSCAFGSTIYCWGRNPMLYHDARTEQNRTEALEGHLHSAFKETWCSPIKKHTLFYFSFVKVWCTKNLVLRD